MNKFISESDVEEKRKQRQLEWEKVRKAEDPVEFPEAPVDSRSLYERLQEQTDKKQAEFEEKMKFKNQFRGIDEDEARFLETVAQRAMDHEKKQRDEEGKEMEEFRQAILVDHSANDTPVTRVSVTNAKPTVVNSKQSSLLKMAVKRKSDHQEKTIQDKIKIAKTVDNKNIVGGENVVVYPSSLNCAGVLPGIGGYDSDSGSDSTQESASEDEEET